MYLAKYIICAMAFAAALIFAFRTRAANSLKSRGGAVARGLLSLLLLAFVWTIWHYATVENLTIEWVVKMSRYVPAVLYVAVQPDIWAETVFAVDKPAEEALPEAVE